MVLAVVGLAVGPSLIVAHDGPARDFGPSLALARPPAASPTADEANTVIDTISNISAPLSGTFDPADGDLYFPDANYGLLAGDNSSNLTVISGATNSGVGQLYEGPFASLETPTYVPEDQEVYVPNQNGTYDTANNVTVLSDVDTIAAEVNTGNSSSPTTGVYDPATEELFVADQSTTSFLDLDDNVSVINVTTNSLTTQILVGIDPITGVYDPADGDIYVPNNDLSETNVSVIDGATNAVVATIGGLEEPITPAYDPVNQEVYVVDEASNNVTVLKGTSVVATVALEPAMDGGDQEATPAVDPVTGEVYIPAYGENDVVVLSPENEIVATIGPGPGDDAFSNYAPTYDPANGYVYVAGEDTDTGAGLLYAIDTTSNTVVVGIPVGTTPQTPTFDPVNDDLYVPNIDGNTISVVGGGTATPPPPGTYSATFSETGLTSGLYWDVTLNGTVKNETSAQIVFNDLPNGSYPYTLGPWEDPDGCVLNAATDSGSVVIDGASELVYVSFTCSVGSSPPPPSSGSSGFLGLPGNDGYYLIGLVVVVVAVLAVALAVRSRGRPPASPSSPGVPPPPPPPPPRAP